MMKSKIIICLCVEIFIGVYATLNQRIIGGQPASIQHYPYQISMRWTYGVPKPKHFCGGSIVSNIHIITAAHCVDDKQRPDLLKYIQIYTGTSRSDSDGKFYAVKSVKIHPGYSESTSTLFNDIAIVTPLIHTKSILSKTNKQAPGQVISSIGLLDYGYKFSSEDHLNETIKFNAYQQPIKLPNTDIQNGANAVVTGWGFTTRSTQDTPTYLQKAPMRLVPSDQCKHQVPYALQSSQICAHQRGGIGVCSGDSGGPLAANGELVGIASYVVECGKGYPDVYTNVYAFINFIKQNID